MVAEKGTRTKTKTDIAQKKWSGWEFMESVPREE